MIDRREFLKSTAALSASIALTRGRAVAQKLSSHGDPRAKPNLLFIQPDEFRIQALGIWNQPGFRDALKTVTDTVHTPALNQLAKESLLFTRAAATASVCSPSRAMLMSGMYPSQNGVSSNCMQGNSQGMHGDIKCFTDVLSDAGYETALVGKTHWERNQPLFDKDGNYVGMEAPPGGHFVNSFDTYIPPGQGRHGNKYWYQTIKDRHFDALGYSSVPGLLGGKKDGDVYQTRGFSSNIEAGIVIDYLKNNDGQRDPHKPFSMMWDPIPPHMPYDSVKDCEEDIYREYYKDLPPNQLLNRLNVDVEKAKDDIHLQTCARVYFSLVTSIDREVGRVLQALEQSGEAENTIVVFTSDHGEMMGSHGLYAKSQIYEEAYLIPFMIRFPKKLKPRMEYLMIGKVDVMPTLLGLMGLKDRIPHTVQGVDYSVGLVTESFIEHPNPRSSAYLMEDAKGVRTDRYSYRVGSDGSTQLFDNSVDPYQLKNLPLTAIDPADRRFLEEELGMWLKKASDPFYQSRMHRDLITYPA